MSGRLVIPRIMALAAGLLALSAAPALAKTLQVDPDAPAWIHAAALAILVLHIGGGAVGLVAGATALLSGKGGRLHRAAGNAFFVGMLVMSGLGAIVSPFLPERASTVAGVLTFYLVATAWLTVRRREGAFGRIEVAGVFIALGVTAAAIFFFLLARNSPGGRLDGQPPQAFIVFLVIASIAAAGDLHLILRRGLSGVARIARHLWRMCVALFIAAASLFLGQPQIFPEALLDLLPLPVLAVLLLMTFWLLRVRIGDRFKTRPVAAPVALVAEA